MNKIGVVLGVSAVAVLAGCLDPNYKAPKKTVFKPTAPVVQEPEEVEPVTPVNPVASPTPAVDDTEPLQIKAYDVPESSAETPDVRSVDTKPVVAPPVVTPAAQPETTTYIVQRGDTLAKISRRYNITQAAIKKANPKMKGDVVKLGQKLVLPGKVDVGEQKVPEGAFAKAAVKPAVVAGPYTGATTDYVVQKGDVLGVIARKHGCTVKQLKELNGMTSDVVVVGKKIKVPAASVKAQSVAATPAVKTLKTPGGDSGAAAESRPAGPVATPKTEDTVVAPNQKEDDVAKGAEEPIVDDPAPVPPAPPAEKYVNYTVQEGDDLIGISINCDLTVSEIRQINNLSDDAKVTPGMVLKLPADSVQ